VTVVVDSSAIVAVLLGELDAPLFAEAMIRSAGDLHISVVTRVEAAIVLEARQGSEASADLQTLLDRLSIQEQSVTAAQADLALRAWRRFGKGRHPAKLNFGDCFSYALATSLNARLLFKGDDFRQTDVAAVLA
jgi:ribonuclease VapC